LFKNIVLKKQGSVSSVKVLSKSGSYFFIYFVVYKYNFQKKSNFFISCILCLFLYFVKHFYPFIKKSSTI